jgi:hypothetical protein
VTDESIFSPSENGVGVETPDPILPVEVVPSADPVARRRADIDDKQAAVTSLLTEVDCEAVILLVPAHLAWFCGGLNTRGLFADSERPGVYTNGRMRWLVCGNADTQRLFDEELDGLGFMLKEWQWATGRPQLLAELVANRKVASDRPFPGLPMIAEKLRPLLRPLYDSDRERLLEVGEIAAHALEATARGLSPGDTEQEVAGQLGHRCLHHGADVAAVSVTAGTRGDRFRRSGFSDTPIDGVCTLQLTAVKAGLHATASRTVSFGPLPDEFRAAHESACKLAAVFRSLSRPGETVTSAVETGYRVLRATPFEHDWRLSPPGYGTGWFAAEELRKAGADEPFVDRQPLVWQARLGAAAVVDTVIVGPAGGTAVTPPTQWPFKKITIAGTPHVIPDVLVRPAG